MSRDFFLTVVLVKMVLHPCFAAGEINKPSPVPSVQDIAKIAPAKTEQEIPKTYTIKKGDTLWDLSETFFADPFFWPKMWAMNAETILNPHLIFPDQEIHFFLGSESSPPKMSAEEVERSAEEKLIPLAKSYEPVAPLPSTLPGMEQRQSNGYYMEFDLVKHPSVSAPSQWLTKFLVEGDLAKAGSVVGTENGYDTAGPMQYVYIDLAIPPASHDRLLVVVQGSNLQKGANGGKAAIHEIVGQVQIDSLVGQDPQRYRAKVVQALSLIPVGANLVRADPMVYDLEASAEPESVLPAQLVTSDEWDKLNLFGPGAFAFVNAGKVNGVKNGGVYTIFRGEAPRDDGVQGGLSQRPIGAVKVVQQTDQFSTVVVLRANEELRPGDSLMPNNTTTQ